MISIRDSEDTVHVAIEVHDVKTVYLRPLCYLILEIAQPAVASHFNTYDRQWRLDDATMAHVDCIMCLAVPEGPT